MVDAVPIRGDGRPASPLLAHRSVLSIYGTKSDIRDGPGSPPLVGRLLAVRHDLLGVAQQALALRVLLDDVHGTAKVGDLAVGREDLGEKQVGDGSLQSSRQNEDRKRCRFLSL